MLFWYESGVKVKNTKRAFRRNQLQAIVSWGVCELIYLVKFLLYLVLPLPGLMGVFFIYHCYCCCCCCCNYTFAVVFWSLTIMMHILLLNYRQLSICTALNSLYELFNRRSNATFLSSIFLLFSVKIVISSQGYVMDLVFSCVLSSFDKTEARFNVGIQLLIEWRKMWNINTKNSGRRLFPNRRSGPLLENMQRIAHVHSESYQLHRCETCDAMRWRNTTHALHEWLTWRQPAIWSLK